MNPLFRIVLLSSLLSLIACIDVPEVEPPSTGADAGTQPPGGFSLNLDAGQAQVLQGGSRSVQVSLTLRGDFSESVTVGLVNPPTGIDAQPVTLGPGSPATSLVISVSTSAEPGSHVLTVRGTAGDLFHDVFLVLSVERLGDLVVQWASPSQSKLYVRGSVQLQVAVEGGTAESVEILKDGIPLARLSGPAYLYTWDTTQVEEGEYQLTARAMRGTEAFTSMARTIVVDRTAPRVVMRTPEPGARFVSIHDPIQVSFDEALKASSILDSFVVLSTERENNVAKALSLSEDGKTLTILPNAPLSPPATVTLSLGEGSAAVTDLAGNALSALSWSFTVPAWLPMGGALSARDGDTSAENVVMKVGADGNPVIAWSEFDGSSKNVHVRRWDGMRWTDVGHALSASPDTGTHAEKPSLALDSEGRPVVVWEERTHSSGPTNLHGRRWSGSDWEPLPAFDMDGPFQFRSGAAVAFDKAGNLLVAADENVEGIFTVQLFRLAPGGVAWERVAGRKQGTAPSLAGLATDSDGRWVVAQSGLEWDGQSEYRAVSVQRKVMSSETWSQLGAPVCSPAHRSVGAASLAVDGTGRPWLAWDEEADAGSSVYVAAWDGAGSWSMTGGALNSGAGVNVAPSMVTDGNGNPIVAWSGYLAPEQVIRVSRWNGSEWREVGAPLNAVSGDATPGQRPVLALDKQGQPLVAWHESNGSVSDVYVYRYNY